MSDTPDVPPGPPEAAPGSSAPTSPPTGAQQATPPAPKKPVPAPVRRKAPEKPLDPAHVPMTEEFDRARWTLPPVGIVFIGIGIVAVVAAFLIFANRAKPVAGGFIVDASAVQLQDNTVLAAVQLNISNATPKQWYIENIKATVKTPQGEYTDDSAAAATDSERYFQAFPGLAPAGTNVLKFDQKLAPGEHESGTVVFAFPITKDQFDQRQSLTVVVKPFDNLPVTFTK